MPAHTKARQQLLRAHATSAGSGSSILHVAVYMAPLLGDIRKVSATPTYPSAVSEPVLVSSTVLASVQCQVRTAAQDSQHLHPPLAAMQ